MRSISGLFFNAILVSLYLVSGQVAVAETKIISCVDPMTHNRYLTNVKTSVPENCQQIETLTFPPYKQSSEDNGLRPSEKAQLQEINRAEEQRYQAALTRSQYIDESVGAGVYGSWRDNRHDQCFAYQARVEEALADRKDDVKLNRQIRRDLTQIKYYCP